MVVVLVLPHCTYQCVAEWLSFRTRVNEGVWGKKMGMKRCFGIDRFVYVHMYSIYIYIHVYL